MFNEVSLTFTQSLQMVAIVPCVLVVLYLLFMARHKELIAVPVLYFTSLAMGILYYLLPAFLSYADYPSLKILLMLSDISIPAFSFLLIFQFMLNRIPPVWYWAILLVPVIAFGPFVVSSGNGDQLCIAIDICVQSNMVMHFENVVISSFVFILLTLIVSRRSVEIIGDSDLKKYKYWLIISLIIYNIVLLALDLALVDEAIRYDKYVFAKTMVKIAFIYMVMTSIFRVFTDLFDMRYVRVPLRKTSLTKYEQELASKVKKLLEENKAYQEVGFNRAMLAKMLGISEHLLSRIINIEFKKSFSDLTNDYRIKDARELLSSTSTPITTISFDVGFNSIASFNRVFKRINGKSPSEYREDMKKEII